MIINWKNIQIISNFFIDVLYVSVWIGSVFEIVRFRTSCICNRCYSSLFSIISMKFLILFHLSHGMCLICASYRRVQSISHTGTWTVIFTLFSMWWSIFLGKLEFDIVDECSSCGERSRFATTRTISVTFQSVNR